VSEFDNYNQGQGGNYYSNPTSNSNSDLNPNSNPNPDFNSTFNFNQNPNPYGDDRTYAQREEEKRRKKERRKAFWGKGSFPNKLVKAAAIALVFGLVAGAAFQGSSYMIAKKLGTDTEETAPAATLSKSQTVDSTVVSTATTVTDVSDIVENVMPAIVAVTNVSYTEYRNFFGGTRRYESESAGSGIICSEDSDYLYIATNNHVVSGAESITITFCNDTAVPGTVKGTDSSVDLAVVAVALSDIDSDTLSQIKVATIGSSDNLSVGESAVVIGNALGYGQSVTTGVISALSREVQLEDDNGNVITNNLIQTDAAVNPGNSGGALLNMKGEVVGIVSAKYSDTSVEGMGYAIPISSAENIIETLITQEVVSDEEASYFGIAGADVTSSFAKQYGMPTGVYVSKVASGSGAEAAGIKKGDIITGFNGRTISSMDEISNMMQYIPAGTTVDVTVAQAANDYEETTVQVTLTNKSQN
jgi:serine protease Do